MVEPTRVPASGVWYRHICSTAVSVLGDKLSSCGCVNHQAIGGGVSRGVDEVCSVFLFVCPSQVGAIFGSSRGKRSCR